VCENLPVKAEGRFSLLTTFKGRRGKRPFFIKYFYYSVLCCLRSIRYATSKPRLQKRMGLPRIRNPLTPSYRAFLSVPGDQKGETQAKQQPIPIPNPKQQTGRSQSRVRTFLNHQPSHWGLISLYACRVGGIHGGH